MALGPFARILAQVALVAGSAIGRAFVQAFQEAAQKGATQAATRTLRRQMPVEEAYKILGIDTTATTREEIAKHYSKLYEMNAPTGSAAGSPYLQQRIENAQKVQVWVYATFSTVTCLLGYNSTLRVPERQQELSTITG
ncbi:hypothetical protein FOZ61_004494 [Perkinsus olseni]|uniref:Mitochondrial import inner membrane translocase subunit TIM16 n=1 Tax=Perkinsus olseni TaxID=32597 RepID=A0A7J6LKH2_PEROL|nr:hypothetical protein FOZ61_004494 [Perkinsus olseni]